MTDRTAYVKSLRAFADLIETNSDIPLPYKADELTFYVHASVGEALAIRDLMVRPVYSRDTGVFPVRIKGRVVGFLVEVAIHGRIALDTGAVPAEPALVPALAALLNPATTLTAVTS